METYREKTEMWICANPNHCEVMTVDHGEVVKADEADHDKQIPWKLTENVEPSVLGDIQREFLQTLLFINV